MLIFEWIKEENKLKKLHSSLSKFSFRATRETPYSFSSSEGGTTINLAMTWHEMGAEKNERKKGSEGAWEGRGGQMLKGLSEWVTASWQ